MTILQEIRNSCETLWFEEQEQEIINTLSKWHLLVKIPRMDYHFHKKYALKNLAGVTKVILQSDDRVMATKETALSIIRDIHVSINHNGDRKTHKKLLKTTQIFLEN